MHQTTWEALDERGSADELALQHPVDTIYRTTEPPQRKIDMCRDDGVPS
jgi:hypothetical protein